LLVEAVFLLLFLGWGLFPLLSFAGDASLDPSRLALLPLRPGQLVAGLSLAACVGVAPLCTLVALGGAVVGFATLGPGIVLVVAAVLVQFALCIVGGAGPLTPPFHHAAPLRTRGGGAETGAATRGPGPRLAAPRPGGRGAGPRRPGPAAGRHGRAGRRHPGRGPALPGGAGGRGPRRG